MQLSDLIEFARDFAALGDAVGEQAVAMICDGEDVAEQNPSAVRMVRTLLAQHESALRELDDEELVDDLDEFFEACDDAGIGEG